MPRSPLPRVVRSAGAIVLAAAAIIAVTGVPAQARDMLMLYDDMENGNSDPATRFRFESTSGSGGLMRYVGDGYSTRAYSGSWAAALLIGTGGNAWAGVVKKITVPYSWVFGTATTCQFSAWVSGLSTARFSIEVLNNTETTYLTAKTVVQPNDSTFIQAFSNKFPLPTSGIVSLRVKYLGPGYIAAGYVDDFQLICTYV